MFDAAGAIDYAISFDPYGVPIEQYVGANNTNLGFTGEQTNANGLVYLRARHYDPSTGTFLSRDPVLGAVGGRSIRFNGYAYAGANPVNYTDPNGEFFWMLGLFLLGGGLDIGAQMLFEGKELGEVDMLRAGISGATALIGGGAGFLSGKAIQHFGLSGMRALAAGATAAAVDFGAGVAADHYLLGDSMGTAVFSNVLGFGIGEALGYGVKGLGRVFRRSARNTVEETIENATDSALASRRGASGIGDRGTQYTLIDETPSTRMQNQELDRSCTAACGVQILREHGLEVEEATLRELMGFDEVDGIHLSAGAEGLNRAIIGTELEGRIRFEFRTLDSKDQIITIARNHPEIVRIGSHAVIVDSLDDRLVRLRDPWGEGPGTGIATEGMLWRGKFDILLTSGWFETIRIVELEG